LERTCDEATRERDDDEMAGRAAEKGRGGGGGLGGIEGGRDAREGGGRVKRVVVMRSETWVRETDE
jgi:hypothetical protein